MASVSGFRVGVAAGFCWDIGLRVGVKLPEQSTSSGLALFVRARGLVLVQASDCFGVTGLGVDRRQGLGFFLAAWFGSTLASGAMLLWFRVVACRWGLVSFP